MAWSRMQAEETRLSVAREAERQRVEEDELRRLNRHEMKAWRSWYISSLARLADDTIETTIKLKTTLSDLHDLRALNVDLYHHIGNLNSEIDTLADNAEDNTSIVAAVLQTCDQIRDESRHAEAVHEAEVQQLRNRVKELEQLQAQDPDVGEQRSAIEGEPAKGAEEGADGQRRVAKELDRATAFSEQLSALADPASEAERKQAMTEDHVDEDPAAIVKDSTASGPASAPVSVDPATPEGAEPVNEQAVTDVQAVEANPSLMWTISRSQVYTSF